MPCRVLICNADVLSTVYLSFDSSLSMLGVQLILNGASVGSTVAGSWSESMGSEVDLCLGRGGVMVCGEPPVPSPSPAPAQPAHQPDEGHLEADWVWLEEHKRLVLLLGLSRSMQEEQNLQGRSWGLLWDFFLCHGLNLGCLHSHTFTHTPYTHPLHCITDYVFFFFFWFI